MSVFAGSQLSADDLSTLHDRYHDTMDGTFAADKHHNLPRPLRSYLSTKNDRNISVLSTTAAQPLPAPNAFSSSSVFRTPQWNEFSDYVRELSPPAETRESGGEGKDDGDGESSESKTSEEGERDLRDTSAAHSVVDRLAVLSRSPDADPAAIAAALREAEEVLQHPAQRTASSRQQRGQLSDSQKGHGSFPLRGSEGGERVVRDRDGRHRRHPVGRAEHLWESDEADRSHYYPSQHRNHSSGATAPRASQSTEEFGLSSNATRDAWPWPTHTTPPSRPVYPSNGTWGPPSSSSVPHNSRVTSPSNAVDGRNTGDATAHWYEVYYAWMLYYQQLYATQILQYEHQQRRNERRDARRQRSQRCNPQASHASNRRAEPGAKSNVYDDHRGDAPRRAAVKVREGATVDDDDDDVREPHSHPRHHHESSAASHRRHHRSHSSTNAHATRTASEKEAKAHSRSVDTSRTETQQLRAQLQQLEDKLAALSTVIAQEEEAGTHLRRNENSLTNAKQTEGQRRSPEANAPSSLATQTPQAKPAAAATRQALTERQRSRSGARKDRDRHTTPRRPQWR